MRRTHVESIVCGAAMAAVACSGGSHPNATGFVDASIGSPSVIDASFPMDGASEASADGSGGSSSGSSSSSSSGSGDAAANEGGVADAGGDAAACKLCPAGNICCSDPSSNDYGNCYSPQCVGCCASAPNGSCVNGGSCGSNESCCSAPGSIELGQCYPNTCTSCCPATGNLGGGGDASACPSCPIGEVCCSTQGAYYGRCYSPSCTGCCQ